MSIKNVFQYTNIKESILFHYLQGIADFFYQFKAIYDPF